LSIHEKRIKFPSILKYSAVLLSQNLTFVRIYRKDLIYPTTTPFEVRRLHFLLSRNFDHIAQAPKVAVVSAIDSTKNTHIEGLEALPEVS
jgi:hypothetical protein